MKWGDQPKTLREIEALPGEILTCANVAKVLRAKPTDIHAQAMAEPERLGFPVIVHGTRVKIPKTAFLRFMKEGKT